LGAYKNLPDTNKLDCDGKTKIRVCQRVGNKNAKEFLRKGSLELTAQSTAFISGHLVDGERKVDLLEVIRPKEPHLSSYILNVYSDKGEITDYLVEHSHKGSGDMSF
jgi:hypothetical protein